MNCQDPLSNLSKPVAEGNPAAVSLSIWSVVVICLIFSFPSAEAQTPYLNESLIQSVIGDIVFSHGEDQRDRVKRCVEQVAHFWREEDGTAEEFAQFCRDNYISDPQVRQQTTDRFEVMFERVNGHFREMGRALYWNMSVATGPLLPIDYLFARYSPGAHATEDMFKGKIAFYALLNFPLITLEERLSEGASWSRQQWAQARLVERFSARVPPEVSQIVNEAFVSADTYISDYYIYMHHLLNPEGDRPFSEGLKLISHWNLRDELKSQYAESDGLPQQEMIYDLMMRIIRQEIPEAVINNPAVDWKLSTNVVTVSPIMDGEPRPGWDFEGDPGDPVDNAAEPNTRYEMWLGIFRALKEVDPYYPTMPTLMDRRFQRNREMPEAEVEQILEAVVSAPVLKDIAGIIENRLGRPLRPFDIWYNGFAPRGAFAQEMLDSVVGEKYPTVEDFQADLPAILAHLGFDSTTSQFLASHIAVDPSRGIGHAAGPGLRNGKARLRTRVLPTGMDFKGYNIAMHEFGHNVEQVFSAARIDNTLLRGVPNTAFTEAFAFAFQARDLEYLGLADEDPNADHLMALDELWGAFEIGGVSLVDMRVWNWMYEHPEATPAELKAAVISIARDVWNEYFAPVLGIRDCELLSVYSHMIDAALYLPDYPLGSIIAFQVGEYLGGKSLATEMERMCTIGSLTPGLWMERAVGSPISVDPLLEAARAAVEALSE